MKFLDNSEKFAPVKFAVEKEIKNLVANYSDGFYTIEIERLPILCQYLSQKGYDKKEIYVSLYKEHRVSFYYKSSIENYFNREVFNQYDAIKNISDLKELVKWFRKRGKSLNHIWETMGWQLHGWGYDFKINPNNVSMKEHRAGLEFNNRLEIGLEGLSVKEIKWICEQPEFEFYSRELELLTALKRNKWVSCYATFGRLDWKTKYDPNIPIGIICEKITDVKKSAFDDKYCEFVRVSQNAYGSMKEGFYGVIEVPIVWQKKGREYTKSHHYNDGFSRASGVHHNWSTRHQDWVSKCGNHSFTQNLGMVEGSDSTWGFPELVPC